MRNGTAARFSGFAAGLLVLVASGWFLTGQASTPVAQGFPTDWSHRHIVFRARQIPRLLPESKLTRGTGSNLRGGT